MIEGRLTSRMVLTLLRSCRTTWYWGMEPSVKNVLKMKNVIIRIRRKDPGMNNKDRSWTKPKQTLRAVEMGTEYP